MKGRLSHKVDSPTANSIRILYGSVQTRHKVILRNNGRVEEGSFPFPILKCYKTNKNHTTTLDFMRPKEIFLTITPKQLSRHSNWSTGSTCRLTRGTPITPCSQWCWVLFFYKLALQILCVNQWWEWRGRIGLFNDLKTNSQKSIY